jgi:hypothetical protein
MKKQRSILLVSVLFVAFIACLLLVVNYNIKVVFNNRLRHAEAMSQLLDSIFMEQGEYPQQLDDFEEAFTMAIISKPFGSNLYYHSDKTSYIISEKEPKYITLFRKGRIIVKGSPKISKVDVQ